MLSQVQLSYIFAILKYSNFQRAADACHVTQPTLSMQLKKAEEMVGFPIINRDTTPFTLTKNGALLYPKMQAIQEAYDDFSTQLLKLKGNYTTEIRLGIIPTVSNYLVPEIYAKWQNKIGSLHLDITELNSEDLLEAVQNKQIDFGIMAGPITDFSFQQFRLFKEKILIYAPEILSNQLTIDHLENMHPWLLSKGNCLRTQMINFCNLSKTKTAEWNYEGSNLNILVSMVQQEGGYTLIPENYLPYLSVQSKDVKTIKERTPIREIIGFSLKRNTKMEEIKQLVHLIQQEKNKIVEMEEKTELLPWKE